MGVFVRPQGRFGLRPTELVAFPVYDWKGIVAGSRLTLPATRSGHSSLRRMGKSAPMEWLMRNEGPMRLKRAQPPARMASSWRGRLGVRGRKVAIKASKIGSPMTPFYRLDPRSSALVRAHSRGR